MGGGVKDEAQLFYLEPGQNMPAPARMYSEEQMVARLCALLGLSVRDLQALRTLDSRMCNVERRCESMSGYDQRCRQIFGLMSRTCCPGNVLFSQPTLDGFSDDSKIEVTQIVKDFAPGFANSFPVSPGQSIRLTHLARPGYVPEKIALDMSLAGNATNYLDIRVQFYIVPADDANSPALGKKIGPEYRGNEFLGRDGSQIHLAFPMWRDQQIIIGSLEQLAATVTHGGAANNLDSMFLRVYHDNNAWFSACCSDCKSGKSCSCSAK